MIKYHGVTSLAKVYANAHDLTLDEASTQIKRVVELLEFGVCDPNYDGIQFINSFTFRRQLRKARPGMDVVRKQLITIPPRNYVKVELGKDLNQRINKDFSLSAIERE